MPAVVLSQLLDLALGTPEVGAVNFNVLHSLLHAIIKKLNIAEVTAEINDSDRDFLSSSKIGTLSSLSKLSDLDSGRGEDSEDAMSEKSGTHPSRPPYHQLELKVAKLTEQMNQLNSLPSNSDLFDRTKAKGDGERPIADMWQYVQMKKRVDANGEGVGKLMSLVEDLMRETQCLKDSNNELIDKVNGLNIEDLLKKMNSYETLIDDLNFKFSTLPTPDEIAQFVTWPSLEDALNGVRRDFADIKQAERVVIEMSSQTEPRSRPSSSRPSTSFSSTSSGPSGELLDVLERLGKLSDDHAVLKNRVDELEELLSNKADKDAGGDATIPSDLLEQLASMKENLDSLLESRDKDNDALNRAQQAILKLQAELERIHNTTQNIIDENQTRTIQIEGLEKQCDKLDDCKVEKEYVQMEVDQKADKHCLDGKVNHALFDSTTSEINKLIKEILDKFAGHEEEFKEAMSKITEDVDGKLDRLELDPLKEWLNSRLKALNDKLKKQQMTTEWSEDDAAGIRKQLVQQFHCISCDRPVEMVPTGPVPALPTHLGLPPTRSPRPYTTFELDQIRQHARSLNKRKDYPGINTEVSDYYATPRPCGGTHTMTCPQKRITHLTHLSHLFREEEQVYPVYKEEVDVQGVDGHIYKGRVGKFLDAKLPGNIPGGQAVEQDVKSPSPRGGKRSGIMVQSSGQNYSRPVRPTSARTSPRPPSSAQSPRPQSARNTSSRYGTPGTESTVSTPLPTEDSPQMEAAVDQTAQVVDMPIITEQ